MKPIIEAFAILIIISVATVSSVIAYSVNQTQTKPTNSTAIDSNKTSIIKNSTSAQSQENQSIATPSQSPSQAPKSILKISDIKLSNWDSTNQDSVVIIDSPSNNAVYTSSTISLTIHAKAQSHIVLIGVSIDTDWAGATGLFNNINSGWLSASAITITATITEVPDGNHWITIKANDNCVPAGALATINFTVDTSKGSPIPQGTPHSSPTLTPSPISITTQDSAYPEGLSNWLPYGTLNVSSPTNQTYNSTTLVLHVYGKIVAGSPFLSYSLDGNPPIAMSVASSKVSMAQTSISASTTLSNLANGSHVIVVYGDLGFESRKAKITVNFEVQVE